MTDPARCPRCLLPQRWCLCAEVPAVPTQTRVVIVRHFLEAPRSTNTGRLAHMALPNSEIVDHGIEGKPAQLPALDGAWLLFPAGPALTAPPVPPPKQLIVLDATWSQARRMYKKLGALRGLPTLRLAEDSVPVGRLRESPGPGQVSTIEAIARALRVLEGEAAAAPLERLFQVAVERAYAAGRLRPPER